MFVSRSPKRASTGSGTPAFSENVTVTRSAWGLVSAQKKCPWTGTNTSASAKARSGDRKRRSRSVMVGQFSQRRVGCYSCSG
mmetsp:Transcript_21761/g.60432  ORF Transcript_21761/g.60432 Transcript_21761/m.60432 type:complete len:82 (-) Transcript_21761:262-507(-)